MVRGFHHFVIIKLRGKIHYKARLGESQTALLSLNQYINQCKNHLSSTNKWFYKTAS